MYGEDMTTLPNVSITITANDGVQIDKTDEAVGAYIGVDAPHWLNGECNTFVGANFSETKAYALGYLQAIADEIIDNIDDLKSLHKKDMHWI